MKWGDEQRLACVWYKCGGCETNFLGKAKISTGTLLMYHEDHERLWNERMDEAVRFVENYQEMAPFWRESAYEKVLTLLEDMKI
jgi:hypothetical protein